MIAFKFLLPSLFWVAATTFLWYTTPQKNVWATLSFTRFHAFLAAYLCLIFVVWNHRRCREEKLGLMTQGSCAVGAGCIFLWFLGRGGSAMVASRFPDLFGIWAFLSLYVCTLVVLISSFDALPKVARLAPLLTSLIGVLSLGNLFLSPLLVLFSPSFQGYLVPFLLYSNPLVVISSCFPGYDYLRDSMFYTISPLGTWIGPFRYPQVWYACGYYGLVAVCLGVGARVTVRSGRLKG